MGTTHNIFLVGLMGAGKTTIGRQLAKALELKFMDSDEEIEHRTGAAIPLIFEIEGEAGFRKRERAIIAELTQQQGIVLATGGGAILDADNRAHLEKRGVVVYLRTSLDQLMARTAKDRHRPLLQTQDPRKVMEELLAAREPVYRQVADIIIDTDGLTVKRAVKEIITKLPGVEGVGGAQGKKKA